MKTKVVRYNIIEGQHKGHFVTTDAFGIDYDGRNPDTAGWCLDCHEAVDLYVPESTMLTAKEPMTR